MAAKQVKSKSKTTGAKRPRRRPLVVHYGRMMKREGIDMLSLCGSITISVDPIAYQRESRGHV
jgi:hypothetical protein